MRAKHQEHPTSIRLLRDDKRKLKAYAEAEQRSLASLIQTIITQWLKWKEGQK